jgi:hypothetical protein
MSPEYHHLDDEKNPQVFTFIQTYQEAQVLSLVHRPGVNLLQRTYQETAGVSLWIGE